MEDHPESRSYKLLEATKLEDFQRGKVPLVTRSDTARPVCSRANVPNCSPGWP